MTNANPMKGCNMAQVRSDGTVQMKDLRTPVEIADGITLTDEQTIQRLAAHIVSLEHVIKDITQDNLDMVETLQGEIDAMRPYANFYFTMQKTILENPTLMNAWQDFCLMLKMTDPDQSKYK